MRPENNFAYHPTAKLLKMVTVHRYTVNVTAYVHLKSPAAMGICFGSITVLGIDPYFFRKCLYSMEKYAMISAVCLGGGNMTALKIVLSIIFVIICIALSVVILMQEGKSTGLGSVAGMADTYWGKNKGRSMEGALEKFTKFMAVAFMALAIVLNVLN